MIFVLVASGSTTTHLISRFFRRSIIASRASNLSIFQASISVKNKTMQHLDKTQVSYLKEECILVDEQDNIIGSASKAALHRAFSVFLFDTQHRLILQQRSKFKITFPLVWTNSCCSHPLNIDSEVDRNNNYMGVQNAALRKLAHELNIKTLKPEQLELAGKFLYKADSGCTWMEHELDYVLLVRNFHFPINANAEEVANVRFVNRSLLASMFCDQNVQFSPWFKLMYKSGWLERWWLNVELNQGVTDDGRIYRLN